MKYDKALIASNIQYLRTSADMTQADLADKINYSDKAVSKWERGESLPDFFVMKQIADLFGVSLDFFFEEHSGKEVPEEVVEKMKNINRKHLIIALISVVGLWLAATIAFIIVKISTNVPKMWLIF
ncbi:MAG: helix-turn-helix transcriptional regulator, partial [Clostridia bacterium]|nr:helix-turn-helix transcriptional regulator [Clostridia bacterium]